MTGVKFFVFSTVFFAASLTAAAAGYSQSNSATPSGAAPPSSAQTNSPQTNGSAPAAPPPQTAAPAPVVDAPTAAWKMLTDAAASDKYPTRSDAVAALTILDNNRRAVRMLIKALADDNSIIRVQAAASLGEIKARAAIPALRVALDDKEPQVSFAAAQALWKMGDRSGREDFLEILAGERKTQPGMIKANIAKAKAEMHDPKGLILIGINATSEAMLGPGILGVTAVEEMTTNTTAPVQALCAKLLSEDDTPDSVGELKETLDDKNWIVRAAGVRALAGMNHAEEIPAMQDLMQNDKKQVVRFDAAAALIRLDQRQRDSASRKPTVANTGAPATAAATPPATTTPRPPATKAPPSATKP